MTQTLAIFKDAYRELNAKKLFWIVLAISVLVVGAFASLGLSKEGITVLFWTIRLPMDTTEFYTPAQFYKDIFQDYGIGLWLSWIATILALVSTASIIPEFISSGSIELTLSKPIGRLRLFLTKFLAGMLFVALQVTLFSVGAFLVIGIRGQDWEPRIFLAIPIVVCLFSYLFSICVLIGLLTRSTIASLLLTLLVWFFIFLLNIGDAIILQGSTSNEIQREKLVAKLKESEDKARERWIEPDATTGVVRTGTPSQADLDQLQPSLPALRRELEEAAESEQDWNLASRIAVTTKTFFPKTGETVALLGRTLKSQAEIDKEKKRAQDLPLSGRFGNSREQKELELRLEEKIRKRTLAWVLGTSLAFEAFVLGLACWIFCRRDF